MKSPDHSFCEFLALGASQPPKAGELLGSRWVCLVPGGILPESSIHRCGTLGPGSCGALPGPRVGSCRTLVPASCEALVHYGACTSGAWSLVGWQGSQPHGRPCYMCKLQLDTNKLLLSVLATGVSSFNKKKVEEHCQICIEGRADWKCFIKLSLNGKCLFVSLKYFKHWVWQPCQF